MVVRMSQTAAERRNREWVMLAQVIAAGTGAGFSGDWKPIQALARSLGVPMPGRSGRDPANFDLEKALKRLEGKGGSRWRR